MTDWGQRSPPHPPPPPSFSSPTSPTLILYEYGKGDWSLSWLHVYLIFLLEAVVVSVIYNDVNEWIPDAKDVELHGWVRNTYIEYINRVTDCKAIAQYNCIVHRPV